MILFFYGENDYLTFRKVQELKQRYLQKSGGNLNLVSLDGEQISWEEFSAQVQAMPLLATTRLIIVRDLFKNKSKNLLDKIKDFLPKVSPSTVLVFVEHGVPDRRTGLFKALNRPKVAQEFKNLKETELEKFLADEVKDRRGKIEPSALKLLAEFVGNNLWQATNEIEKLINYCSDKPINSDAVEKFVKRNFEGNVFRMIEDMASHRQAKAMFELEHLINLGEPALKILAVINYQYRTIALVKEGGAGKSKLNPYVVRKTLPLAKNMSWQDLAQVYQKLVLIDENIKTGKIEANEGLKDLILGI